MTQKKNKTNPAQSKSNLQASDPRSMFVSKSEEVVLLAVTGMSPAVLTETIWALANEDEPVIPSRVIVVTTGTGKDAVIRGLMTPVGRFDGRTAWDTLRDALKRHGSSLENRLRFGVTGDDIRVITAVDPIDAKSLELDDIRSLSDNRAAADFLLEQVRGVVENPDARLVVSIAGGRKTMGALLYACMTLIGRETDRLTHVLVNEPFDMCRDFYFPNQPGGEVGNGQVSLDPRLARVELADVPFVPLRNLFIRELGRKAGSFANLIEVCSENIRERAGEEVQIEIEVRTCRIRVNGTSVKLAPMEHLLMLFLSMRRIQGEPVFGSYVEAEDDLNQFRKQWIEERPTDDFGDWRYSQSLNQDWTEEDIRKTVSGIRSKLRKTGGNAPALAVCLPTKGRCSLSVPAEMIFIK